MSWIERSQKTSALTTATVTEALHSPRGRQQLVRARIDVDAGGARATPVGGAGSHLIAGLAQSDALIVLAEGVTRVDRGDQVPVLLLDRPTR